MAKTGTKKKSTSKKAEEKAPRFQKSKGRVVEDPEEDDEEEEEDEEEAPKKKGSKAAAADDDDDDDDDDEDEDDDDDDEDEDDEDSDDEEELEGYTLKEAVAEIHRQNDTITTLRERLLKAKNKTVATPSKKASKEDPEVQERLAEYAERARKSQVKEAITDYLDKEELGEYRKAARYIAADLGLKKGHIDAETGLFDEEILEDAVANAVDRYIEDNPAAASSREERVKPQPKQRSSSSRDRTGQKSSKKRRRSSGSFKALDANYGGLLTGSNLFSG